MEEISKEQVEEIIRPELRQSQAFPLGGKEIVITPMKRRWQALFTGAAMPLLRAELAGTEAIQRAVASGSADFESLTSMIINSEIDFDKNLDRPVAIILASKVEGAEKKVDEVIKEKLEWLLDNATTEELRVVVEAQAKLERLVESVGERLPARFVRSLRLAGDLNTTADTVKRLLMSFLPRLPDQNGDGSSATPKPGTKSSDGSSETMSPQKIQEPTAVAAEAKEEVAAA